MNSSSSSINRSRSQPPDRLAMLPNKKQRRRRKLEVRREHFIREKELMFKRKSTSRLKPTLYRSFSNRIESNEDKLQRLYKQYSNEETLDNDWKPMSLNDCADLYQYALEKYHGEIVAK